MLQEILDRLARQVPPVLLELLGLQVQQGQRDLQVQRALREQQVQRDLLVIQEVRERLDLLAQLAQPVRQATRVRRGRKASKV